MMGNTVATWQLSMDGLGRVEGWMETWDSSNHQPYAGGFASLGFDDGSSSGWDITVVDLGGGQVAMSVTPDGPGTTAYYLNSHYATTDDLKNGGMYLAYDDYLPTSVGPEQTFVMTNLGGGAVALKATAGAFPGKYLSGIPNGWYPEQFGFGSGSFVAADSPAALRVSPVSPGNLLPILDITGSGYMLDLSGLSLGSRDLSGVDMQQSTLSGADLSGIKGLQGANFTQAILRGTNLRGLSLGGATWAQADFTSTDLTGVASAAKASLPQAKLDRAKLTGVNLSSATLQGASLKGAVLDAANLFGANLAGADLTGASLRSTDLRGANLQGTRFDGIDLATALFDPAPNFTRAATNRTSFVGATLPASVIGTDWAWLDLTGATITSLPASLASLKADGALLPDGLDLQQRTLSSASFVGTRMYEVQLENADLRDAKLSQALLKGARLSGANLTGASLDSAWLIAEQSSAGAMTPAGVATLEAAVATGAFLFNTMLDGAHCDGVDFSGAVFATAAVLGSAHRASAVGASMNFAKFDSATVLQAAFDGAQLSAASFAEATLVGSTFRDDGGSPAQLTPSSDVTHTPASVYHADIRGVNFTGANMDGLEMRGATVSTTGGEFAREVAGFGGATVPVAFKYGPTLLGNTTASTLCPDGSNGPCSLSAAAA
jgi:uncharacterized protein YjbI with pentapeptide repeats